MPKQSGVDSDRHEQVVEPTVESEHFSGIESTSHTSKEASLRHLPEEIQSFLATAQLLLNPPSMRYTKKESADGLISLTADTSIPSPASIPIE